MFGTGAVKADAEMARRNRACMPEARSGLLV